MKPCNILTALQGRERDRKASQNKDRIFEFVDDVSATSDFSQQQIFKNHRSLKSTFMVIFSHDGSLMATSHGNHDIKITQLPSMKCIQTFTGHPRTPWCMSFHPSSNEVLASACLGGEVRVWDMQGRYEIFQPETRTTITSLSFHPTQRILAIATLNYILLWDWSKPTPLAKVETGSRNETVRLVRFDQYGHHLLTGIANSPYDTNPEMEDGSSASNSDTNSDTELEPDTYPNPSEPDAAAQSDNLPLVPPLVIPTPRTLQTATQTPAERQPQSSIREPDGASLPFFSQPPSFLQSSGPSSLSERLIRRLNQRRQQEEDNEELEMDAAGSPGDDISPPSSPLPLPVPTPAPFMWSNRTESSRPSRYNRLSLRPLPLSSHHHNDSVSHPEPNTRVMQQVTPQQISSLPPPALLSSLHSPSPLTVSLQRNINQDSNQNISRNLESSPMDTSEQDVNTHEEALSNQGNESSETRTPDQNDMSRLEPTSQDESSNSSLEPSSQQAARTEPSNISSTSRDNLEERLLSSLLRARTQAEQSRTQAQEGQAEEGRSQDRQVRIQRRYNGAELVGITLISETFEGFGDRPRRLTDEELRNAIIVRTEERFEVPDMPDLSSSSRVGHSARMINFSEDTPRRDSNTSFNINQNGAASSSRVTLGQRSSDQPDRDLNPNVGSTLLSAPTERMETEVVEGNVTDQDPLPSTLLDRVSRNDGRVQQHLVYPVEVGNGVQGRITITTSSPANDQNAVQAWEQSGSGSLHPGSVLGRSLSRGQGARRVLPARLHTQSGGRFSITSRSAQRQDNNEEGENVAPSRRSRISRYGFGRTPIMRRQGSDSRSQSGNSSRRMRRATLLSNRRRTVHRHHTLHNDEGYLAPPHPALHSVINQAIAQAFSGRWSNMAVANNISTITHRLQWWDFKDLQLPDITDTTSNVIVPHCKLYTDASCDISQDETFLATFVPVSFPDKFILGVYSLQQHNFGDLLYKNYFGPDAVTVSISPMSRYIFVGLANKFRRHLDTQSVVGKIFKLKKNEAEVGGLKFIQDVYHRDNHFHRQPTSLNIGKWIPIVGQGLVYGTDRGHVGICKPMFNYTSVPSKPEVSEGCDIPWRRPHPLTLPGTDYIEESNDRHMRPGLPLSPHPRYAALDEAWPQRSSGAVVVNDVPTSPLTQFLPFPGPPLDEDDDSGLQTASIQTEGT